MVVVATTAKVPEKVMSSRLYTSSVVALAGPARHVVHPEPARRATHGTVSLPVWTLIVHLVPIQKNANNPPHRSVLALK
jgi:hypothetical protein